MSNQDTNGKKLMRFVLLCCGFVAAGGGLLKTCSEKQQKTNEAVAAQLNAIEETDREMDRLKEIERINAGKMTRQDVARIYGAMSAITAEVDEEGYVVNLAQIDTLGGVGSRVDKSSPDQGETAGINGNTITDTWGPKSKPKRGSVKMIPMGSSTYPNPDPETMNQTMGTPERSDKHLGKKAPIINARMFDTDGR